ncbi:hypothetical protein GALMADRAFT_58965 [Galerina marginata CBS 339.88]|uniref:THH1/TOM1/TOM3 domain-containing protein n=1 Tax=Galerina marginata (strain CBS 339.88) TaxID=685588 RepID=A0A067TIJ9_GALM3|nr:hypothetical protein GALMADRAFT_58965 [Galerina marginata CBS 339.88]
MATNIQDLKINYAKAFGIHSVAAAVIFAILYVPLFGWFVRQSLVRRNYVYVMLMIFCAIRITAFAIRAALAGMESAAENLNLLIADVVLSGVGYFGLLYSAYTLVLDLELLTDRPPPRNPLLLLIRNRKVFRFALSAGVALGIASATIDNGQSTTAKALHKVSVIVFLILTVLQAFQTAMLARMDMAGGNQYKQGNQTFGRQHGIIILMFISLLLLIREAFSAATLNNTSKANNEHFWYPLVAVPEILAVLLYSTPDLVPRREELPTNNTSYPLNTRPQQ